MLTKKKINNRVDNVVKNLNRHVKHIRLINKNIEDIMRYFKIKFVIKELTIPSDGLSDQDNLNLDDKEKIVLSLDSRKIIPDDGTGVLFNKDKNNHGTRKLIPHR